VPRQPGLFQAPEAAICKYASGDSARWRWRQAGLFPPNKSILDWYHAIPKRLLDDYKYQIRLKNNVFVSRSRTGYEVKPIVNIQNGYLKIMDGGTGGGSVVYELVFLQTNKGIISSRSMLLKTTVLVLHASCDSINLMINGWM
jgi:hypothetical protein